MITPQKRDPAVRPHLTLITAITPHLADHFPDTARSVGEAARLCEKDGWSLGWSVCIDGAESPAIINAAQLAGLGNDRLSVLSLGGQWGVSTARNVAAAAAVAANADWVLPLDADDLIVGSGVSSLCKLGFNVDTRLGWIGTNRTELDGSLMRESIESSRLVEKGVPNAEYTHPYCVHPNNVAYRPNVLVGAGGWPATPGGEDLALFLQVTKVWPGILDPAATVRYRRWEQQTVNQESFTAGRPLRYLVLGQRGLLGGREPIEMRYPRQS